jgi:hypothetical protein
MPNYPVLLLCLAVLVGCSTPQPPISTPPEPLPMVAAQPPAPEPLPIPAPPAPPPAEDPAPLRCPDPKRLEELVTRQAQQLRDSQRRIDLLNEKLEALVAIERSLTPRSKTP